MLFQICVVTAHCSLLVFWTKVCSVKCQYFEIKFNFDTFSKYLSSLPSTDKNLNQYNITYILVRYIIISVVLVELKKKIGEYHKNETAECG